jgi:hypothetical protein
MGARKGASDLELLTPENGSYVGTDGIQTANASKIDDV